MDNFILRLRPPALAGAALLLLAMTPNRAHAVFTLTLSQVGPNVVVNGFGTINVTGLSYAFTPIANGEIEPDNGILLGGSPTLVNADFYTGISTGPGTFGPGGGVACNAGTGAPAGVDNEFGNYIVVPSGYTSGSLLTDSSTYADQTFATLGFTPGTYTYTFGTGANADSVIVTSVVPEPSTWALLGAGALLLGMMLKRRFRALAAIATH